MHILGDVLSQTLTQPVNINANKTNVGSFVISRTVQEIFKKNFNKKVFEKPVYELKLTPAQAGCLYTYLKACAEQGHYDLVVVDVLGELDGYLTNQPFFANEEEQV